MARRGLGRSAPSLVVWLAVASLAGRGRAQETCELTAEEDCPGQAGNANGDEDSNADDRLLHTSEEDADGNKIEIWCLDRSDNPATGDNSGGHQFGVKYVRANGTHVWVGRCKFEGGLNRGQFEKDANDVIVSIRWVNISPKEVTESDQKIQHGDNWVYDATTNDLMARPGRRPFGGEGDLDKDWEPDTNHPTPAGAAPANFTDLIEDFSTGTTESAPPPVGSGCPCCTEGSSVLTWGGLGQGGSVALDIFGQAVRVTTSQGATPASVASSLGAAVNANSTLAGDGIRALWNGPALEIFQVGGEVMSVSVTDPGLRWTTRASIPICQDRATPASFTDDVGGPINDLATSVFTLDVDHVGAYVWDIELETALTHTWSADLDIALTSPAGTTVTISTDNGGGNDDLFDGTLWDEHGNDPVTDHAYVNQLAVPWLSPEGRLTAFRGEDPHGIWTLSITDDAATDVGNLSSWTLHVLTLPIAPATNVASFSISSALPIADLATTVSTVSVSGAGTELAGLKLYTEIAHTWSSDLDVQLVSPEGTRVTITSDNGFGHDDVFDGTWWDPASTQAATNYPYANLVVAPLLGPEGPFDVFRGEDPNGTWKLLVTDDFAADVGTLHRWGLEISTCAPRPSPVAYCTPTAPGSSSGCAALISATEQPSVFQSNPCVITVTSVEGAKTGLVFYGLAPHFSSWCPSGGNSSLCVKAPTQRTGASNSGGASGQCNGSLVLDWNAYQSSHPSSLGNPWLAGQHAYVQGWFRDPASCKTTFLSQALDMTYLP